MQQNTVRNLLENNILTPREAAMIGKALSPSALADVVPSGRATVRATIFKHILLSLMQ